MMMALIENISLLMGTGKHPRLRLRDMIALRRQRRALAKLDDRALKDIGLTTKDATQEATRPIWDVPSNWRC